MNWLDIVILAYLVVSVITGIAQGLIKSVLSLVGIIVGLILAANYYHQLANVFGFISNKDIAEIVAFILIMGAVLALAALLALVLKTIINSILLGWVDRIGGGVFGLLMGVLTVSGILAVIVKLTGSNLISESAIAGFLLDKFPIVLSFLPSEFKTIRDFFQ
ncbi:MAG: CvpA family protein [Dehalococcoidales bacterium]|nr:CvpA family protein [Dehalococcoidales bacterium]